MSIYKITANGVFKKDNQKHIPNHTSNSDWNDYLAWVSRGNVADTDTLDERKASSYSEAVNKANIFRDGGIIMDGVTFSSDSKRLTEYCSRAQGVRLGFPWPTAKISDSSNVIASLNLDGIELIMNFASELHDLIDENLETLRNSIYSSDSPEEIDITTGWPTVPYAP